MMHEGHGMYVVPLYASLSACRAAVFHDISKLELPTSGLIETSLQLRCYESETFSQITR